MNLASHAIALRDSTDSRFALRDESTATLALLGERARVNSISFFKRIRFSLKRIAITATTRPAINIGTNRIDRMPRSRRYA